MATLRGKGSMKSVELVVVEYPNAHSKDGKRAFLDVMVRPVEGAAPQQVPHLVSTKKELDGKTVYDHQAGYSASQRDAFVAAAGDNIVQMPDRNGRPGPTVYAIQADVMSASGKQTGLVINSKTVKPSELEPIDKNILDTIYAASSAAASKAAAEADKARKAAEKEAQTEAAAEAQVSEPEAEEVAEIDEPEF